MDDLGKKNSLPLIRRQDESLLSDLVPFFKLMLYKTVFRYFTLTFQRHFVCPISCETEYGLWQRSFINMQSLLFKKIYWKSGKVSSSFSQDKIQSFKDRTQEQTSTDKYPRMGWSRKNQVTSTIFQSRETNPLLGGAYWLFIMIPENFNAATIIEKLLIM